MMKLQRIQTGLAALLCAAAAETARANYPGSGAVGSLGELSPAAASFAVARGGSVGVAVYNDKTGKTYLQNGFWGVRVASTAKVGILTAVLGKAQREGRGVNSWEHGQLWSMITQSDNNAASNLWNYIGPWNVRAYLQSIGSNLVPDNGSPTSWGYSWASAYDLMRLVAKIQYGQLWSADKHAYALNLMRNVTSWQAFMRGGLPWGTNIAEKCGWYNEPETGTWRVHSVAAVNAGGSSYTIVVMTRYPAGWGMDYGIDTIRGVAARVHAAFLATGNAASSDGGASYVMYRLRLNIGQNVHNGPGWGYHIAGVLQAGTIVDVYGFANGWLKIWYSASWQYIAPGFSTKIGLSVQATADLRVETGYGLAGILPRNCIIHCWQWSNVWYRVWYNGAWRWIWFANTRAA